MSKKDRRKKGSGEGSEKQCRTKRVGKTASGKKSFGKKLRMYGTGHANQPGLIRQGVLGTINSLCNARGSPTRAQRDTRRTAARSHWAVCKTAPATFLVWSVHIDPKMVNRLSRGWLHLHQS